MMSSNLAACTFLLAALLSTTATRPVPIYSINLDSTPSERWKVALTDFVERNGVSSFEKVYTEWHSWLGDLFPNFALSIHSLSASHLLPALKRGHPDLVAELQTLSEVLSAKKASPAFEVTGARGGNRARTLYMDGSVVL